MALIGLLSIAHPREDLPGVPRASLMAGGLTLIERNVRLLHQAGVSTVYILVDQPSPKLSDVLEKLQATGQVEVIPHALDLAGLLAFGDRVVLIEEGVLIDARLLPFMTANKNSTVAVWPVNTPQGIRAVRLDSEHGFASILICRSEQVINLCKGLGEWDLEQSLLRAVAGDSATQLVDLSEQAKQTQDLRQGRPLVWQPMSARPDEDIALRMLIDNASKVQRNWPEQFYAPAIENSAVQALASTGIQAAHILVLILALGILVLFLFAEGWLWAGVLVALLLGPLGGLRHKLADIRLDIADNPALEKRMVTFFEVGCCCALAWNFSGSHGIVGPWAITFLIIVMTYATQAERRLISWVAADTAHAQGSIEQWLQRLSGSRAIYLWLLLLFALLGSWFAGFIFIGFYAASTFIITQRDTHRKVL
jgi:hypothetical protein